MSLLVIGRDKGVIILAIWGAVAFIPLIPVLQTFTLSPTQTRPSMVQWLNPQSPTTPSCTPAATPPSPKSSPFPFSLPATVADKPPDRYVGGNMTQATAAVHGGAPTRGESHCSPVGRVSWEAGSTLSQGCARSRSKYVLSRNTP